MDLDAAIVSFLSTLLGVLIAFGLSLWYDRRKRKIEQRGIQSRILNAIRLELKDNVDTIDSSKKEEKVIGSLLIAAFDSAVAAGQLSYLSPELQNRLSNLYADITWQNKVLDGILSLTGLGQTVMQRDVAKLEALKTRAIEATNALLKEIPEVLGLLDTALKELDRKSRI